MFALTRYGIGVVALGAAAVHTGFLLISYLMLARGSIRQAGRTLSADLLPGTASCIGLAAAAVPVSIGLSSMDVATVPYLAAVSLAAGIGYLVTLRVCFPAALQSLVAVAQRVLPRRAHRVIALFGPRAPMQVESTA